MADTVYVINRRATPVVIGAPGATVVKVAGETTKVLLRLQGAPGAPAKVSFGSVFGGPYTARQAIMPGPLELVGAGVLTAAASKARAWTPCTGQNVWSATLNGTFASEAVATNLEIAAALFATITFPPGAGPAVFDYPTGGAFADGDALRLWESPTPDATQAHTSVTFAGA